MFEQLSQFSEMGILQIVDFFLYHVFALLAVFLIVFTMIVYQWGSRRNLEIAKESQDMLHKTTASLFTNYNGELVIESPNVIKVYASGQQSCLFMIMGYALVPRQQIISKLFNSWLIRLKDQLVIQIPLKTPHPIPLTLAVVRKKNLRTITKKSYPDVKNLCKQYRTIGSNTFNVPQTHSLLVEQIEHVKFVLASERQVKLWQKHGRSVKLLYLSDINKFSRYDMAIRMVINLGEDVLPLFEWLMNFVSRMAKMRMSSGERRQAKKRRQGIEINFDEDKK